MRFGKAGAAAEGGVSVAMYEWSAGAIVVEVSRPQFYKG